MTGMNGSKGHKQQATNNAHPNITWTFTDSLSSGQLLAVGCVHCFSWRTLPRRTQKICTCLYWPSLRSCAVTRTAETPLQNLVDAYLRHDGFLTKLPLVFPTYLNVSFRFHFHSTDEHGHIVLNFVISISATRRRQLTWCYLMSPCGIDRDQIGSLRSPQVNRGIVLHKQMFVHLFFMCCLPKIFLRF